MENYNDAHERDALQLRSTERIITPTVASNTILKSKQLNVKKKMKNNSIGSKFTHNHMTFNEINEHKIIFIHKNHVIHAYTNTCCVSLFSIVMCM